MPPKPPTRFAPRKLLVAAAGVATLNYLASAACTPPTSGNLPAPTATTEPTTPPPTSGNLPAPPPTEMPVPSATPSSSADAGAPSAASGAPSSSSSGAPSVAPPGSNRNTKPQFKPPRPPTAGNLMAPGGQTK